MNSKHFNVVAAVTAVLVVWAVILASAGHAVVIEFVRGQTLVSDLAVERVNKIEVTTGITIETMTANGNQRFWAASSPKTA